MRILVVVRQVPDSRATLSVLADGSGIDRAGLKFVCDPFDEFGVAQAVAMRGQRSDVEEIVAITVGPVDAVQNLRMVLAMGADRGIHVVMDESVMHDEVYLARAVAAAIGGEGHGFDVVLCGKQGIDHDAGELGPALAECLGLPHIGAAVEMSVSEGGDRVDAKRQVEGAVEVMEARLPILVTCEKGLVEVKYPTLPNIMKAKKKPVETIEVGSIVGLAGVEPRAKFVGLSAPPAREACQMIEGEPGEMAAELVRVLREEAKVI